MSEVQATGVKGSLSTIQLDVTNEDSVQEAAQHVEEKYGLLDALINNAGVGNRNPDVKTRMQNCMDTNVIGPAVVASVFRPLLLKAQKPYSIFVSSGSGSLTRFAENPPSGYSLENGEAYRASKAALNIIAINEAKEFGPKGLMVFPVAPGFVVSNLRGTEEEARNGWGGAGDPMVSGRLMLAILEGRRDADVGKLVHKDGVYPW
ncbi:NAD(P)-binding protein [Viridothelium virens]|uniref:NAD(P)-binding protein n=1 Tax=Viridothelium virens TaxID=1048519 RepID=A0A6A6GSY0_VIRVR|nr:NAD(P)-binding protein [Viridothelium virens]